MTLAVGQVSGGSAPRTPESSREGSGGSAQVPGGSGGGDAARPTSAPAEEVELTCAIDGGALAFTLDEGAYPRDAVLGAAYHFVDRCHVFLSRASASPGGLRVRMKPKRGDADLEALAGAFANELVEEVVRLRVAESTSKLREYYTAKAFFGANVAGLGGGIEALLAELDREEASPPASPRRGEGAKDEKNEQNEKNEKKEEPGA